MDKKVFEIVRNYRKTRVIKHRKKKYVPPISVETRRMSKIKNIPEGEFEEMDEEILLPKAPLMEQEEVILKDLTSQEDIRAEVGKEDDAESTPFGEHLV